MVPICTEFHKDLIAGDLHVPGYCQSIDPGAIGAGKYWIDTTLGAGFWILKVRNSTDTGWEIFKMDQFIYDPDYKCYLS